MTTKNTIKKLTDEDATTIRNGFITHLKGCNITSIDSLWGEAKAYAKKVGMEMGGSYASWDTSIAVRLLIHKNHVRFSIDLKDLK